MCEREKCANENQEPVKRRRAPVSTSLKWRFPSVQALKSWLTAAHIMSLKHVAETVKNRGEEVVATLGTDSTTKAAGHRIHDVTTSRVTLRSTENPHYQQSFTLGLLENLRHSGEDGARSLRHNFQALVALCGSTQTEMQGMFDFFMGDRGPDVDPALTVLGVNADQWLKCCPHMLLAIDEACDKVFRQHEQAIGSNKLLQVQSHRWSGASKSTSILTLVLIACPKLLSPSHAQQLISLYGQFCEYLRAKGAKNNFKGFVSNRFGRRAKLCIEFRKMYPLPLSFLPHFDWFCKERRLNPSPLFPPTAGEPISLTSWVLKWTKSRTFSTL